MSERSAAGALALAVAVAMGGAMAAPARAADPAAVAAPASTPRSVAQTPASAPAAAASKLALPLADDPALEARMLAVAQELRCLVCQNETIAASNADLAVDLRKQIRLKLLQGESPRQIVDFMVERYGDFVLYRPPVKSTTWLLWAGPFVLLLVAAAVLWRQLQQRRRRVEHGELSAPDRLRAQQLLDSPGGATDPASPGDQG